MALTYPTANLWVGVGCRQKTPRPLFEQALQMVCAQYSIDWAAIAGLATIDTKQTEPGLLAFSLDQHWPLSYFTQAELDQYTVPNPSGVVKAAIGVFSVCEAAALRAAAQASPAMQSTLIVPKQVLGRSQGLGCITVAIAMPHL